MNKLPLIAKIVIAVVVCAGIGALSGIATANSVNDWYLTLNKPPFNPPNWLFAPAWTLLYTLMGIAAALVWHKGLDNPLVKSALGIFAIQLALNALWSILFFGMQNPTIALVEIIILWGMILWTILKFNKVNKTAGWLLVPYLAWVTFATVLNASIVYLN